MKQYLFVFWLLCSANLFGQALDTVKVIHYNLLNYDNNTSFCTNANNSTTAKNGYLKTIVHYFKPDIFTCNEVSTSGFGQSQLNILNDVMNQFGETKYEVEYMSLTSNSDISNAFFYNKNKFDVISTSSLAGNPRNIDVVNLYYKDPNLTASSDTTFLTCIIGHFKAGSSSSDQNRRLGDANLINTYLTSTLPNNRNVLVMGDFNINFGSEAAFNKLTETETRNQLHDPYGNISNWNSSSFAYMHTQSTVTSGGCKAGGGLDDRFDMILYSTNIKDDSAGFKALPTSYEALGNDAQRWNSNITSGSNPNTSQPDSVIQAIFNASDHLPVYLELTVDLLTSSKSIVSAKNFIKLFNPSGGSTLHYEAQKETRFPIEIQIYNSIGKRVNSTTIPAPSHDLSGSIDLYLQSGLYIVKVKDLTGQVSTSKIVVSQ